MKVQAWTMAVLLVGFASYVPAVEEPFCTTGDSCQDDIMRIRVTADNKSVLTGVTKDSTFVARVTIDVRSEPIAGFSYGVAHDKAFLAIPQPPADDCANDGALCNPTIYGLNVGFTGNCGVGVCETLIEDSDAGGFNATAVSEGDKGFISAIVLSLKKKKQLPLAANDFELAKITYKAIDDICQDAGKETKIFFSNDLNPIGSPPTALNLTTGGKSKQPRTVDNALISGTKSCGVVEDCKLPATGFYFGKAQAEDYDVSTQADKTKVAVLLRNKGIKGLGFSLGIKKAAGTLTFEDNLGSPVVDLVFTKDDGTEINGVGLKGNKAINAPATATDTIKEIKVGAALAGNSPGDFFGPSIDASGLSATVGYVSDISGSNKVIAQVADAGAVCGGQEILVITIGGAPPKPKFSRGDANGDGKINVTDGVIMAQNIFQKKLVFFDCAEMLDANDDGQLNTADPTYLLTYIFLKGALPAAPFKTCGEDPTTDTLGCVAPNCQ